MMRYLVIGDSAHRLSAQVRAGYRYSVWEVAALRMKPGMMAVRSAEFGSPLIYAFIGDTSAFIKPLSPDTPASR